VVGKKKVDNGFEELVDACMRREPSPNWYEILYECRAECISRNRSDLAARMDQLIGGREDRNLSGAELVRAAEWRRQFRGSFEKASRSQPPSARKDNRTMASEQRKYTQALPSQVFPDFPLNPQNLSYDGALIKDEVLLNVVTVALIFLQEMKALRQRAGRGNWPGTADKELSALEISLTGSRMTRNFSRGIRASVNASKIHHLAEFYLNRLRDDRAEYAEFMSGRLSVYFLMLDFAQTLGCGSTLQTALEWHG
jgi:hypothetical protein